MAAYYNEIDPYCCRVLRKQIAAGNLPDGFVDERDIRDVRAGDLAGFHQIHLFAGIGGIPLGFRWAGMPDDFSIMSGGFPCQDISNAGKRAGIGGERSGLWSEYLRLIRAVRPSYVLVENVAALLVRGIGRVLGDLAESGFDAEWSVLPACALGFPHTRERVFIVAYADGLQPGQRRGFQFGQGGEGPGDLDLWPGEPEPVRVADGIRDRVDRNERLANAVVPQAVELIGRRILSGVNE